MCDTGPRRPTAELDPETRERLQALCRQITVAHELDPEIQEELYGHMEDKLLAYLSGVERLTEQDAFVLVREHFGDAGALIHRLRETHAADVHVGFARRAAMAFVASSAAFLVGNALLLFYAVLVGRATQGNVNHHTEAWLKAFPFLYSLSVPLSAAATVLILRRWRRAMCDGNRPWTSRNLVFAVLVVAVASKVAPFHFGSLLIPTLDPITPLTHAYKWFYAVIVPLSLMVHFVAWVWWCEPAPRTGSGAIRVLVAWALSTLVWVAIPDAEFLFTHDARLLEPTAIVGLSHYIIARGSSPPFWFDRSVMANGHSAWSYLVLPGYNLLLLWAGAACAGIWMAGQVWVSRQRKARRRRHV